MESNQGQAGQIKNVKYRVLPTSLTIWSPTTALGQWYWWLKQSKVWGEGLQMKGSTFTAAHISTPYHPCNCGGPDIHFCTATQAVCPRQSAICATDTWNKHDDDISVWVLCDFWEIQAQIFTPGVQKDYLSLQLSIWLFKCVSNMALLFLLIWKSHRFIKFNSLQM